MTKTEPVIETMPPAMENTSSLEELQSHEQRALLNAVGELRHQGLESLIPLPQIVVCGDQSAGKSSVLEAISEIPFPRNDNLCTRFATEIVLQHAPRDSITMRVIPNSERTKKEQDVIRGFCEFILDFSELPTLIDKAMTVMGINTDSQQTTQAFAKDVLSITIQGPSRAHLTLVDLPGLIQTQSRGVTAADIRMVQEITDHYISQSRTIILAVISAAYDHPCQGILQKILKPEVDPQGKRTLGVITKPDRLSRGSGAETAYIGLASNKDRFLHLGWHVLKNRAFEDGDVSFEQRNALEAAFLQSSGFNTLDEAQLGITNLRNRLSTLLFEHIKREMPKLQNDLENGLVDSSRKLQAIGEPRVTLLECKEYLARLDVSVQRTCEAALNGNYVGDFFGRNQDLRRLRAAVQKFNVEFTTSLRTHGHKYHFAESFRDITPDTGSSKNTLFGGMFSGGAKSPYAPKVMSKAQTISWIKEVLERTRGRELPGNFNALVVSKLFWEQSSKWGDFAERHLRRVANLCTQFMKTLLDENCVKHVHDILWTSMIKATLKQRQEAAEKELSSLLKDLKDYPINYNHYYTDTKRKRRLERETSEIANCFKKAKLSPRSAQSQFGTPSLSVGETFDEAKAAECIANYLATHADPNMDNHACEDAMDSLLSIYKLCQKTFVANVTTQVIERHIVRGLQDVFSPITVYRMSDAEALRIASEPPNAQRQRRELKEKAKKLQDGNEVLQDLMGSATY